MPSTIPMHHVQVLHHVQELYCSLFVDPPICTCQENIKKKPAASKSQGKSQDKSKGDTKNIVFEAAFWGSCKAEFYSEKSYIRNWDAKGVLRSVIGAGVLNHVAVISAMVKHVEEGLSKAELIVLRDQYIKDLK